MARTVLFECVSARVRQFWRLPLVAVAVVPEMARELQMSIPV